MQKLKCNCPNCKGTLVLQPEEKGRKNVFICKKCGCTQCLTTVMRTSKCCGIEMKRKKKKFIRGQKGEKIDVSVDNPKLQKLADESVPVLLTTPFNAEIPKRKRGRPKKDPMKVLHESIEENKEVLKGLNTGSKKRRGRPPKSVEKVEENVRSIETENSS